MILEIKGASERLKSLLKELKKEGVKVDHYDGGNIEHLTFWGDHLDAYYHKGLDVKLNANLPSHRKHFKRRVLEYYNRN